MSLPDAWIEKIFDKLTLVYGHQFLSRWDGIELAEVKADWAHELRCFAQSPQVIAYGLENLPPTKPPTVLEFRAICSSPHAPRVERPLALPNHMKTAEDVAVIRHMERLERLHREHPEYGGASWAFALELKDQEEPRRVTPTVRAMYREVVTNFRLRHGLRDEDTAA
jgi:hypothetical protein